MHEGSFQRVSWGKEERQESFFLSESEVVLFRFWWRKKKTFVEFISACLPTGRILNSNTSVLYILIYYTT